VPIGPLEAGAAADLVVLDYEPATPLTPESLAGHVAMGLEAGSVDAVMVDGAWRVWARQMLSVDLHEVRARATQAAQGVWSRMAEL
jgi:cytosine/adenosine deaminase-related metal-dependent hydrolase